VKGEVAQAITLIDCSQGKGGIPWGHWCYLRLVGICLARIENQLVLKSGVMMAILINRNDYLNSSFVLREATRPKTIAMPVTNSEEIG